jgi:hypothetical protein
MVKLEINGHLRYLPGNRPLPPGLKPLLTETMKGPPATVAWALTKSVGVMTRALQKSLKDRPFEMPPNRKVGSDYSYTVDSVADLPNGISDITVTLWYETAGP